MQPSHPRDRMARRSMIPIKEEIEERDLVLTKVQPSHPRDRMTRRCKVLIEKELDIESLFQTPYY